MAKKPLMTEAESEFIGWDGEMLDKFPHEAVLVIADRYQLVRLYRYLPEPQTPEQHEFVRRIITKLEESYPMPVSEPEPEPEPEPELHSIGHETAEPQKLTPADILANLLDNLPEGE